MEKLVRLSDKRKQAQRGTLKAAVLSAFDSLVTRQAQTVSKPQRLDTDSDTRRKAKQQL